MNTLATDGNDMNISVYTSATGDIAASSCSTMCHLVDGGGVRARGGARARPSGPGGAAIGAGCAIDDPPQHTLIWFTVTPNTNSASASHCMTLNRRRVIVLSSTAITSTFRFASMRTVVGEK